MAKTFVVNGGNFSAVALDKVMLVKGADPVDPVEPTVITPHWVVGMFANSNDGDHVYGVSHASCVCAVATSGSLHMNGGLLDYYPIVIPDWVKSIRVDAPNCWIGMTFSEKSTEGDLAGGVNLVSGFVPSSSTGIGETYTTEIPDGANCFTVTARLKSGNAIETTSDSVTITLLP